MKHEKTTSEHLIKQDKTIQKQSMEILQLKKSILANNQVLEKTTIHLRALTRQVSKLEYHVADLERSLRQRR